MKCVHYRAMDSTWDLESAAGKFYLHCELMLTKMLAGLLTEDVSHMKRTR
jgi:hypothetical protein